MWARRLGGIVAALAFAAFAADANAEPAMAEQCASASERAQLHRLEGHLVEARAELVTCSAPECPSVVRRDCDRWLVEVDDAIPSVVVTVRDAAGADVADARVTIDGEQVLERVEARALPLDPGTHEIEIAGRDGPPVKRSIVLREGEKRRVVDVTLPRAAAPPAKPARIESKNTTRVAGWSLVALGGVGVALGAALGIHQHLLYERSDSCRPVCSPKRADEIDRVRLFEGIALGAGALALAAGVVLLVTHPAKKGALRPDALIVRF
ncbi:MAG: hypothetical protein KIT84_36435 [Labilithrix sp.]|nr:hypothetical protein [Labilithrix sp.]MCW5816544.1 hypothetical protein [Labilithrix sp.]